jgi:hypothetical protein
MISKQSRISSYRQHSIIQLMRFSILAFAIIIFGAADASAQTSSTCRTADADGIRFRSFVRRVVSSSDPFLVQARTNLGLRSMDSTRVVFVTDNTVCNKAAQGINAAQGTTYIRQMYVVAAGTVYAAQDPGHPSGEWWPTVTLDNKFKVLAVILAP